MAFTLIINPGSSSKKLALYKDKQLVLEAHFERMAEGFELCLGINGVQQKCEPLPKEGFGNSLINFLALAIEKGVLVDKKEIKKVVLRVVAPGTYFQTHRLIDEKYLSKLKDAAPLAPLHLPQIIQEVEAVKLALPESLLIAASDSAFHATIPDYIRRFSLPTKDSVDFDIYRFGYHGLSVSSVIRKLNLVSPKENNRIIVCHIGRGVSVTAVSQGKSVDTTMGYAPGSGLIMGSRAGDVTTAALLALMTQRHMKPLDAVLYLQTSGGLVALAGESDLRVLLERRSAGDKVATDALASFVYQIQKAIGSYVASLGGLDALIFTGTAGVRSSELRRLILESLAGLGLKVDQTKNDLCLSRDGEISTSDSPASIFVSKTAEAEEMLHLSNSFD
ncbi:MAG TPA: hypothetical protein PKD95_01540 [Candidatus Paceibacterota bacterium]|nr:hypothetical protein [Candidatus Paceibacterota bacterium]